MALLRVTAAQPLDMTELSQRQWRRMFGLQARQVIESEALTFRTEGGELVAICGLWLDERQGWWEAWFAAAPACGRHMLPLVRMLRRCFADGATIAPGTEVRAYVDGVAGPRMLRWLGFADVGLTETPAGVLPTWRRVL